MAKTNDSGHTIFPKISSQKDAISVTRQLYSTRYLQLILLVMTAFMVNVNTLSNGFVYDDNFQVLNNNWITNVKYIPDIFSHDATHAEADGVSNYYRPVMNLIYLANYYVFDGLKSWGFHLVNVLLHVGVTILVFLLSSMLAKDVKPTASESFLSAPLVSALIFAVHPVNSEVIAWVACVPELSFTLLGLLSLRFHMKSLRTFDKNYFVSLSFFGVAILCKETTVILLPIFAIYDYMFRTNEFKVRRNLLKYAPYALIVGIYLVLRFNALGGLAPLRRHPELNTFEVIINVIPLFSQYLEKLLVPVNLNAFYVLHPVHHVTELKWIFSFIIVLAFAALGFVLFRRSKSAFFGVILITIPLLPVLYIRGLGENTFADRYLYLPSVGFALIAGFGLTTKRIRNMNMKTPLTVLLIFLLGVYSIGTVNRNSIWHDDLSLWSDTVQKSPEAFIVQKNTAISLIKNNQFNEGIEHYTKALLIHSGDERTYTGLAAAYDKVGLQEKAIETLYTCLRNHPDFPRCHNELGCYLQSKGLVQEAIYEFETASILNPKLVEPYSNMGHAYLKLGLQDKAIQRYQAALQLNPEDPVSREDLAKALRYINR